ncbi:reverse transcriptase domain-containing protein [Tanacetum coccineum]
MSASRQGMTSAEINQIVAQRVSKAIEAISIYETKIRMTHDSMNQCSKCKRVGHTTRDCKAPVAEMNQRTHVSNPKATITCYECGRLGHFRNECQKLRNQNQVNKFGRKKLMRTLVSSKTRPMLKKRSSRLT